MTLFQRIVLIVVLALLIGAGAVSLSFRAALFGEPGDVSAAGADTLEIPSGATAYSTAALLGDAGLIDDPRQFAWYLRLRGLGEEVKAGLYVLPRASSSEELATKLTRGELARTAITFPEGWTAEQMASRLQGTGVCDSAGFVEIVRSEEAAASFGYPELPTLDGLLFPETYVFVLRTEAQTVVTEMVDHFEARLGTAWLDSARADPYGLRGILTLASIVEGEINLDEEADDVAAVYRNRLQRGMKLEADPTVQYLLDEPRRLLFKDLEIDSPYNTYRYKGLPPGPINNPGEPALRAAVHPPEHPWLFMVATGDGGHTFTTTYNDHLRAKARFDAHRREVARQQRP